VNLPRLLNGVISGIVSGHPSLEIVGDTEAEDMLDAIESTQPNVVALGVPGPQAESLLSLLRARHPLLRVVTIDLEKQRATVYEPRAAPRVVSEISPGTLLDMFLSPMQSASRRLLS
jgi:DNA-binding NarL/FixJ family response regulator